MTYHYSVFEARPKLWGIVRTREDRVETLYTQSAGSLTFANWNNWAPSDYSLAVYQYEAAVGFADEMNDKNKLKAAE